MILHCDFGNSNRTVQWLLKWFFRKAVLELQRIFCEVRFVRKLHFFTDGERLEYPKVTRATAVKMQSQWLTQTGMHADYIFIWSLFYQIVHYKCWVLWADSVPFNWSVVKQGHHWSTSVLRTLGWSDFLLKSLFGIYSLIQVGNPSNFEAQNKPGMVFTQVARALKFRDLEG